MVGKVLNARYRIDNLVGSGGMADVYKAYDLKAERIVAVKALKKEYCEDPQYLRRFTREAQAMLSLSHKNIVSLYDVGSDGSIHYLVLEYIDGCTLRDYMDKHGALKPSVAVKVVCEVLDGLSHAHENGLVHRDVKPQNVMISTKNEIKLADFGIAKFAESTTRTFEGTEALGSVYYISPEQAKGERVDAQTDIYSVGIMLYEMLTGNPPFTGENAVQIALKHVNEDIEPPYRLNSQIPIALSDVIVKSAARDRDFRYALASDMKRDLLRALKHPKSRFADRGRETELSDGNDELKKNRLKQLIGTIAIISCVVAILGVFAALLLISLNSGEGGPKSVPNLVSKTYEEAKDYAERRGFTVEVETTQDPDADDNTVIEQNPKALEKAKPGTVIKIIVNKKPEIRKVPDLYGLTYFEALLRLEQAGLVLDEDNIEFDISDELDEGLIMAQYPAADTETNIGESVSITLSKNPETATLVVPDLAAAGSLGDAVELLQSEGFENYRIRIVTDEDILAWQEQSSGSSEESGEAQPDDEQGGSSSGIHYSSQNPTAVYKNLQVIGQSPSAGSLAINNPNQMIEIYIYRENRGQYKAEFSERLDIKVGSELVVTIMSEFGELVVYEETIEKEREAIPFTCYYWKEGTYKCLLYVNGNLDKELSREFVREG